MLADRLSKALKRYLVLKELGEKVGFPRFKKPNRRKKAARNTAKTHLKIKRQRRDFHAKIAQQYTEQYQTIVVEKLQIDNMVQNHHLAKSIMDASWGAFLDILEDKAERAGHQVIRIHPRFTSQKCYKCGEIVQKSPYAVPA
jgi:putative transposase